MGIDVVNTEMAEAWDGHEGDLWTQEADRYDRASSRIRQRLLDAHLVGRADHVLDVGCGNGKLARDAARLAADGHVTGIDLSTKMLELARGRAADEGLSNVTFVRGDAQVMPLEPASFDLAMSSFGVMFFNDPVAAFSNIGSALRPGGRLALVVWRSLPENAWLMALRETFAMGRELPMPPPDAPTPFSLADPERVHAILTSAGFDDIGPTPIDEQMDLGKDAADAFDFAKTMGIVEGLTNDLDDAVKQEAMGNLARLLEARETPDGVLMFSATWLITAHK